MLPQHPPSRLKNAQIHPSISPRGLMQFDGETDSGIPMSPNTLTSNISRFIPHRHKRLVLCFDGTAESFEGNSADSNVVKLYSKFDRTRYDQLHYYQRKIPRFWLSSNTNVFPAGVGTYPANGHNWTPGFLGKIWNKLVQMFDQAFAITFNSHIMNGYHFLLRYYEEGDQIYIFGFSRGAFIARFLARMISQVGLLSRGNEQLVPFAYSNFLGWWSSYSCCHLLI